MWEYFDTMSELKTCFIEVPSVALRRVETEQLLICMTSRHIVKIGEESLLGNCEESICYLLQGNVDSSR